MNCPCVVALGSKDYEVTMPKLQLSHEECSGTIGNLRI